MDLHAFVDQHLPAAPSRVLEVGCGRGDLARAMARAGHRVVAIDPEAPDGDLSRTTTLEEFDDPEPFDAVVASLPLHHADLPGALDRVAAQLRPRGRLILNDHAVERLGEPTARLYLDKRAQLRPAAIYGVRRHVLCLFRDAEEVAGAVALRLPLTYRRAPAPPAA
jgi:2-polyprenyl-3-methyl-5-hydroxy-6-metoxy-1,4-benzoquinol methylase